MPTQTEKFIFAFVCAIAIVCLLRLLVLAVKELILMMYDRWERMQYEGGGFMVTTDLMGRQRRAAKYSTCWDAKGQMTGWMKTEGRKR